MMLMCRFWWSDKIWVQIANYDGPEIECFFIQCGQFLARRLYIICCLSNHNHQVFNRISSNSWQVCSQEIIHHLSLGAKKSQKLQFAPWNANRQQKKTTINFQVNCISSLTKLDFGSWQDNCVWILNSYSLQQQFLRFFMESCNDDLFSMNFPQLSK